MGDSRKLQLLVGKPAHWKRCFSQWFYVSQITKSAESDPDRRYGCRRLLPNVFCGRLHGYTSVSGEWGCGPSGRSPDKIYDSGFERTAHDSRKIDRPPDRTAQRIKWNPGYNTPKAKGWWPNQLYISDTCVIIGSKVQRSAFRVTSKKDQRFPPSPFKLRGAGWVQRSKLHRVIRT